MTSIWNTTNRPSNKEIILNLPYIISDTNFLSDNKTTYSDLQIVSPISSNIKGYTGDVGFLITNIPNSTGFICNLKLHAIDSLHTSSDGLPIQKNLYNDEGIIPMLNNTKWKFTYLPSDKFVIEDDKVLAYNFEIQIQQKNAEIQYLKLEIEKLSKELLDSYTPPSIPTPTPILPTITTVDDVKEDTIDSKSKNFEKILEDSLLKDIKINNLEEQIRLSSTTIKNKQINIINLVNELQNLQKEYEEYKKYILEDRNFDDVKINTKIMNIINSSKLYSDAEIKKINLELQQEKAKSIAKDAKITIIEKELVNLTTQSSEKDVKLFVAEREIENLTNKLNDELISTETNILLKSVYEKELLDTKNLLQNALQNENFLQKIIVDLKVDYENKLKISTIEYEELKNSILTKNSFIDRNILFKTSNNLYSSIHNKIFSKLITLQQQFDSLENSAFITDNDYNNEKLNLQNEFYNEIVKLENLFNLETNSETKQLSNLLLNEFKRTITAKNFTQTNINTFLRTLLDMKKQFETKTNEYKNLENQNISLQKTLNKLQSDIKDVENELRVLDILDSNKNKDLKSLSDTNNKLKVTLFTKENILQSKINEISSLLEQNNFLKNELSNLSIQQVENISKITAFESKTKTLSENVQVLENKNKDITSKLESIEKFYANLQLKINSNIEDYKAEQSYIDIITNFLKSDDEIINDFENKKLIAINNALDEFNTNMNIVFSKESLDNPYFNLNYIKDALNKEASLKLQLEEFDKLNMGKIQELENLQEKFGQNIENLKTQYKEFVDNLLTLIPTSTDVNISETLKQISTEINNNSNNIKNMQNLFEIIRVRNLEKEKEFAIVNSYKKYLDILIEPFINKNVAEKASTTTISNAVKNALDVQQFSLDLVQKIRNNDTDDLEELIKETIQKIRSNKTTDKFEIFQQKSTLQKFINVISFIPTLSWNTVNYVQKLATLTSNLAQSLEISSNAKNVYTNVEFFLRSSTNLILELSESLTYDEKQQFQYLNNGIYEMNIELLRMASFATEIASKTKEAQQSQLIQELKKDLDKTKYDLQTSQQVIESYKLKLSTADTESTIYKQMLNSVEQLLNDLKTNYAKEIEQYDTIVETLQKDQFEAKKLRLIIDEKKKQEEKILEIGKNLANIGGLNSIDLFTKNTENAISLYSVNLLSNFDTNTELIETKKKWIESWYDYYKLKITDTVTDDLSYLVAQLEPTLLEKFQASRSLIKYFIDLVKNKYIEEKSSFFFKGSPYNSAYKQVSYDEIKEMYENYMYLEDFKLTNMNRIHVLLSFDQDLEFLLDERSINIVNYLLQPSDMYKSNINKDLYNLILKYNDVTRLQNAKQSRKNNFLYLLNRQHNKNKDTDFTEDKNIEKEKKMKIQQNLNIQKRNLLAINQHLFQLQALLYSTKEEDEFEKIKSLYLETLHEKELYQSGIKTMRSSIYFSDKFEDNQYLQQFVTDSNKLQKIDIKNFKKGKISQLEYEKDKMDIFFLNSNLLLKSYDTSINKELFELQASYNLEQEAIELENLFLKPNWEQEIPSKYNIKNFANWKETVLKKHDLIIKEFRYDKFYVSKEDKSYYVQLLDNRDSNSKLSFTQNLNLISQLTNLERPTKKPRYEYSINDVATYLNYGVAILSVLQNPMFQAMLPPQVQGTLQPVLDTTTHIQNSWGYLIRPAQNMYNDYFNIPIPYHLRLPQSENNDYQIVQTPLLERLRNSGATLNHVGR